MSSSELRPAVTVRRMVAASPERVFAAWTDPAVIARWLSPVGHAIAEVEPWVGGRLRVTMVGHGATIEHTGTFREVVPGRRLVFTWTSPYTGPEPSVVTVELASHGDGTELTLVHERLPVGQLEPHAGGWGAILDRLVTELAA